MGKITERDLNCAVSPPNALIGSRYTSETAQSTRGAYFEVGNTSSMIEDGLYPYFALQSFNVKPMDAPDAVISVNVTGYSSTQADPFNWHVNFPAGFHEPFLVKVQEYSGRKWSQLYGVEITAQYGEDSLDWEFCIDDLEVQFFKHQAEDPASGQTKQAVLEEQHWVRR